MAMEQFVDGQVQPSHAMLTKKFGVPVTSFLSGITWQFVFAVVLPQYMPDKGFALNENKQLTTVITVSKEISFLIK
jgi:hypothetical protein